MEEQCSQRYNYRVVKFNSILFNALEKRSDVVYLLIKGLHKYQRSWLFDGVHYSYAGEKKLCNIIKRRAIGLTSLRPDWIPPQKKVEDEEVDKALSSFKTSQREALSSSTALTKQEWDDIFSDEEEEDDTEQLYICPSQQKALGLRMGLPNEGDFDTDSEEELGAVGGEPRPSKPCVRSVVTIPQGSWASTNDMVKMLQKEDAIQHQDP